MKIFDLKRFRTDKKLTQVCIAELFGCKQNFISQIESGQKTLPSDKIDQSRLSHTLLELQKAQDKAVIDDISHNEIDALINDIKYIKYEL